MTLAMFLYLLDLALQMQQPVLDRYTFGLWKLNILSAIWITIVSVI